jgi:hypothetical protein
MLIKTIVDCDWLNLRYERAKTEIIDLRFQEALANILERIIDDDTSVISRKGDAKGLARDWFSDEETKKTIRQHLWDYGLSEASVVAEAMRLSMEELAQLEQLVQSNERRRSLAYRDLEMWREGKQFRRSAEAKARWRDEGALSSCLIAEDGLLDNLRQDDRTVDLHRGPGKKTMRELRRRVTPEEAKRVWGSQRHPTPRSVARALSQTGRKVDSKTIARWEAQNWKPGPAQRQPLEAAEDRLDTALPLLTGDPTLSVRSILNMQETAKMVESLTEDELLRLRTRALRTAGIVISLQLARRVDELIPARLEEFTILFKAVRLAFDPAFAAAGCTLTEPAGRTNDPHEAG